MARNNLDDRVHDVRSFALYVLYAFVISCET